jgi:osmoprotectant transport system permease protein
VVNEDAMEFLLSLWDFFLGRTDKVGQALVEHIAYVISVVGLASLFAIAIGVLTRHNVFARELSLAIASVFLTIPSLALFTIFIPLVGLGFAPSFIALFLYAILPVLRNTVTGLEQVDPSVMEAAKGMGLTRTEVLLRVQLPLAWPIILAGIRIATMLTVGIAAIATLVAGGGLGDFIKSGLARLPLPNSLESIWLGTLLSLILAFVIDLALKAVKNVTIPRGIR